MPAEGLPEEQEDEKLNLMISGLVDWFSAEYGEPMGGFVVKSFWGMIPGKSYDEMPKYSVRKLRKSEGTAERIWL